MAASDTLHPHPRPWMNLVGVCILVFCYGAAVWHTFSTRRQEKTGDQIVLRLAHWQLEAGIRDGLERMFRKFEDRYYQDTGRRVKIVQNGISERVYPQYVQTQCIGRTAPDLVEIGKYDSAYTTRFFLPLTVDVQKPNPYNAGTPLDGVAWADTFLDGMVSSLEPSNLEYYGAGLSTFTVRIFYNKRLMKEVLGTDEPPKTYREFLQVCETFRQWARKTGRADFVPIAAANYQVGLFRGQYTDAAALEWGLRHDRTYSGRFNGFWERLLTYADGEYDFRDPALRAGHEMLARLTAYFPPGFMSQDRMESGFRFTQGNAVFITSGSWDAMSYFVQADFPIGIMDFPLPGRDDPEFGRFVCGRAFESGEAGFRIGITKFTKHPDVALALLQFLTTPENNEELNRSFKWIPMVKGARPHPGIAAFMPNTRGFWGISPFSLWASDRCSLIYEQASWGFVEHKTTYDQFVGEYEANLPDALAVDLARTVMSSRDQIRQAGTGFSWNLGGRLFAGTLEPTPVRADSLREKAEMRTKYLWESQIGPLSTSCWLARWNEAVAKRQPRALKIQGRLSADLNLKEE